MYKIEDLQKIDLSLQCFEIYNDEIYDLLSERQKYVPEKKLKVREENGRIILEDILTPALTSMQDFDDCLKKYLKNR